MSDEYHFDLSDVQPKTAQAGGKKKAASWIMPVLILILLLAILWQLRQAEKPVSGQQLSEEQVLELAEKLENLELAGAAAATWQKYLEMSNPDAEKVIKSVENQMLFKPAKPDVEHLAKLLELNESAKGILANLYQKKGEFSQCLAIMGKLGNNLMYVRPNPALYWISQQTLKKTYPKGMTF